MAEKDENFSGEEPEINDREEKDTDLTAEEASEEKNEASEPTGEGEPEEDAEKLLMNQIEELRDTHLRLRAEYDNFRKRTLREKSDLLKYAAEKVVVDFLEILDDFDRAIDNIPAEDESGKEMRQGIDLIRDKMIAKLRSQGVKEMEVLGEPFNAEEHEAIAMVPVDDPAKKGTVIDCVQKGYTLSDKVIRHPKVVVGQ